MKYQMKIRSVPKLPVEAKQTQFLNAVCGFDKEWGVTSPIARTPEFGTELMASFPLGKQLGKGIKGAIYYRFRGGLVDIGECDDSIELEFKSDRSDIQYVFWTVLPIYCDAFDAYYGYVGNEEYIYTDFEVSRNRNTRNDIVRVHQANYFNFDYIRRITNGQSDKWLSDLHARGWKTSTLTKGILVVWPNELLTFEKGEELSRGAMEALELVRTI